MICEKCNCEISYKQRLMYYIKLNKDCDLVCANCGQKYSRKFISILISTLVIVVIPLILSRLYIDQLGVYILLFYILWLSIVYSLAPFWMFYKKIED